VTLLDWGIAAFTIALALWGYQQGLVVGALTLGGFAAGAFLGSRVGPAVLEGGSKSPYAPLFAAIGALLLGAVAAVMLEGLAIELRARLVRGRFLDLVDGAGGAVLIGAAALGLSWLFGAVALHAPGATELRGDVQRSLILQRLNEVLPPSGPIINALNRVDPAPSITGPSARVAPPDGEVAQDPDVLAAGDSVVRVLGTACGLGVEGSGWAAAPGLVVTNAHVVAGQDDTSVSTQDGTSAAAQAVFYDPHDDLAVLQTGLDLEALAMNARVRAGARAAVLGYPENGPYEVSPARMGTTSEVISQDAYGRGPVRRRIVALRGSVRSGNSGGPAVGEDGRVLGTIFAATTSGPPSGYGIPNGVVRRALGEAGHPVDTGPCTG